MITVITPFHNCPELIPAYEAAVMGAEVIVIDNASEPETATLLRAMVDRLGGVYIHNEINAGFSHANNQGLEQASGDVVLFLNSDVEARGEWLSRLNGLRRGALYGPALGIRYVGGVALNYLEGWCLAGYTDEIRTIGGWNDNLPALYYEDNELCWRATRAGFSLREIRLPLVHLGSYTTIRTPGAVDGAEANRKAFERMVMEARV